MQNDERLALGNKLAPQLVDAKDARGNKRLDTVPEWLAVAKESTWPDMWVRDYTQSAVITVKGDVRCASLHLVSSPRIPEQY